MLSLLHISYVQPTISHSIAAAYVLARHTFAFFPWFSGAWCWAKPSVCWVGQCGGKQSSIHSVNSFNFALPAWNSKHSAQLKWLKEYAFLWNDISRQWQRSINPISFGWKSSQYMHSEKSNVEKESQPQQRWTECSERETLLRKMGTVLCFVWWSWVLWCFPAHIYSNNLRNRFFPLLILMTFYKWPNFTQATNESTNKN